jgi:Fe-Mn family superoxide dismutase
MNLPEDFTRRNFLQVSAVTGVAMLSALPGDAFAQTQAPAPPAGPYKLPRLTYKYNQLEPSIDEQTMVIHYTKHHQAYVNNLNTAIQGTSLGDQSVEDLIKNLKDVPENIRTAVQNNGGGHANHSMFWTILAAGHDEPQGELATAIQKDLGGLEAFKTAFTEAATKRFGSGWAWLCVDDTKKLHVESTANQDSPLMQGHTPILGIDAWEHAYYLQYQNRRPDYIAAFFNVINWPEVGERYGKAVG